MSMYSPPEFLTIPVLAEVLKEFEWPAPYQLEEIDEGAISVIFPACTLLFTEGYESEIELKFLPEDTGLDRAVGVYSILLSQGGKSTPGISGYFSPRASLEKVQHGIRDLCTALLHHFRASLSGSFDWVPAYRDHLNTGETSDA